MKKVRINQKLDGKIGVLRGYATVDDEDYPLINRHKWSLSSGYPATNIKSVKGKNLVKMHRMIMGHGNRRVDQTEIDHINGDRLDNRKENLRFCSHTTNMRNTKKHRL